MVVKDIDTLIKIAEEHGWNVSVDENTYEFSQYCGMCYDFSFIIEGNTPFVLLRELEEYAECYEPVEEALLWVDSTGHGKNGAPDDIRDIIKDMEDAKEAMEELITAWTNGE